MQYLLSLDLHKCEPPPLNIPRFRPPDRTEENPAGAGFQLVRPEVSEVTT